MNICIIITIIDINVIKIQNCILYNLYMYIVYISILCIYVYLCVYVYTHTYMHMKLANTLLNPPNF